MKHRDDHDFSRDKRPDQGQYAHRVAHPSKDDGQCAQCEDNAGWNEVPLDERDGQVGAADHADDPDQKIDDGSLG
jgi:hypothetical protein